MPTVEQIRSELLGLRRGQALARPIGVLDLSPQVRGHLLADNPRHGDTAGQVTALLDVIRTTIQSLNADDRAVLDVDFNLAPAYSAASLTDRRHALAESKHVSFRTITRTADKALDTLAFALVTTPQPGPPSQPRETPGQPEPDPGSTHDDHWRAELAQFWRMRPTSRIDVVCSEIPEAQRPPFAHPQHRNYLRYAKYANLDSLVYLRTSLASLNGDIPIRDSTPTEYHEPHDSQTDSDHILIVLGSPPWNATYRQFQRDLPCDFQPRNDDDDCALRVPILNQELQPHWTPDDELVEDLAVFTRLSFARGLTVFLLGGCLTLGVHVAAQCFLHRELGARNARYTHNHTGSDDFVLLTEARRFGGITDVPDLAVEPPLLLMSRRHKNDPFTILIDNTNRYTR